jgi:hypothetical protein
VCGTGDSAVTARFFGETRETSTLQWLSRPPPHVHKQEKAVPAKEPAPPRPCSSHTNTHVALMNPSTPRAASHSTAGPSGGGAPPASWGLTHAASGRPLPLYSAPSAPRTTLMLRAGRGLDAINLGTWWKRGLREWAAGVETCGGWLCGRPVTSRGRARGNSLSRARVSPSLLGPGEALTHTHIHSNHPNRPSLGPALV